MTTKELAETLSTIADKAKALRDAGVVGRVSIGDVSFELAEDVLEPIPAIPPVDVGRGSALDDPDTYGGYIPRRRGAEETDDGDD